MSHYRRDIPAKPVPLADLRCGPPLLLRVNYSDSYSRAMRGKSTKHADSGQDVELVVALSRSASGRLFGEARWKADNVAMCTPVELRNTKSGVEALVGSAGDFGGLGSNFFVGLVGDVKSAFRLPRVDGHWVNP